MLLVGIEEIAGVLGLPSASTERLLKAKVLPSFEIGKQKKCFLEDVVSYKHGLQRNRSHFTDIDRGLNLGAGI